MLGRLGIILGSIRTLAGHTLGSIRIDSAGPMIVVKPKSTIELHNGCTSRSRSTASQLYDGMATVARLEKALTERPKANWWVFLLN